MQLTWLTRNLQSNPARRRPVAASVACLLGAHLLVAHAGFIDERSSAVAPAAIAASAASSASASGPAMPLPAAASARTAQSAAASGVASLPAAAASASAPAPTLPDAGLSGDFGADWNALALTGGNDVPLTTAVMELLPAGHPPVQMDAPTLLAQTRISWSGNATRRQALEAASLAKRLHIELHGNKVTVSRAAELPAMATAVAVEPSAASAHQAAVPHPVSPSGVAAAAPTTPAALAARPAVAAAPQKFDVLLSDMQLSKSMKRWASQAGVRIRWDADRQVLIDAPMVFKAKDVLDAVAQALSTPGIRNSDYPLEVCEYANVPPLLRITRRGEQAKDCPN